MKEKISDIGAARAYMEQGMARVKKLHSQGASGKVVVEARTNLVDGLIRGLFMRPENSEVRGPCTLIALGGYGRGELNPHSDLDLLFLHNGLKEEGLAALASSILYVLWDIGLDVGHSIRSVEESLDLAGKDSTARTSLIDLRYLAGDAALFDTFKARVFKEIYRKDVRAFIMEKIAERNKRYEKYGSTVYLLEPNIKEGEGGLRDIHTAHWISKAAYDVKSLWDLSVKGPLTPEAARDIQANRDFLWRVRNELHFLSGRKNDQMTLDIKEKVARDIGYKNTKEFLGVEQLMQDYYRCASEIKQFTSEFIEEFVGRPAAGRKKHIVDGCEVVDGMVTIPEEELFKDPVLIMKAFRIAQPKGYGFSRKLRTALRKNLHHIDSRFRRNPEVREIFHEILRSGRAMEVLQRMHELRFLGRFIPEFDRLSWRAQHDVYHVYTVDTHSLFALRELEKMKRGDYREKFPLLTQAALQVEDYVSLLLAALFHDIGKGWGKGHVERGARMVPRILSRLGYGKRVRDAVTFLVKNHLLMSHVAQRRDLHEEKTIHSFARAVKTQDTLRMLFLLTFADLTAVGPDSWTDWKGALLQELYLKAMEELEEGGIKEPWRTRQDMAIRETREGARRLLLKEYPREAVDEFLEGFHHRYFLVYVPKQIVEHAAVFSALTQGSPLAITKKDYTDKGYSRIILSTWDTPGLLSKIAGVFASHDVNILGVRINVRKDGRVVDTYQVNDFQKKALTDEDRWKKVVEDLHSVLTGRLNVENLVAKRKRPSILREKMARRIPTRVTVDNRSSDLCTIIDVYTHDRPGLLYDMTSMLYRLGLYIAISKISTKVDQVGDVFYVQDLTGRKIMERKKLDEIVLALRKAIDEG